MSDNGSRFRRVLSHFATGVTVVTIAPSIGPRLGFTATAFASLSLFPPLVLVCVTRAKHSHRAITESAAFAVNVLAADQEDLALRFADPRVADRFAGLDTRTGIRGAPLLPGTVAAIECRRTDVFDGGDHSIVVGQVEELWHSDSPPLLHFAGRFARLRTGPDHGADWLVGAAW